MFRSFMRLKDTDFAPKFWPSLIDLGKLKHSSRKCFDVEILAGSIYWHRIMGSGAGTYLKILGTRKVLS